MACLQDERGARCVVYIDDDAKAILDMIRGSGSNALCMEGGRVRHGVLVLCWLWPAMPNHWPTCHVLYYMWSGDG